MMRSPLGTYRPGTSPLHRLRPGAKLLGLLLFAVVVTTVPGLPATGVALVIALAAALLSGLRRGDLWRVLRGFAIVAALLIAYHTWQTSWQRGIEVVGDLIALILAASALTASTSVDDMLGTLVWLLNPLRPLGVKPARVALAFALVLTSIPSILRIASETRAAAIARGLQRSPRALLIPFVLRTVAHAQLVGQALHARGVIEDEA